MSRIYVAVDLETTGFAADRDAILEIGAVKFRVPASPDDDVIVDRWSTLVNPGRTIPYRITRLTGITQQEAEQAPRLSSVLDDLRAFIGNYPVVGHNVAFELAFLQRHDLLVGQANLDTFELASILLPGAPRYSLGQLADYLEIEFTDWHRALADAEMTVSLFLALWRRACSLPRPTLEAIASVAVDSRWSLRSFFAAALRSHTGPAESPTLNEKRSSYAPVEALTAVPNPEPLPLQEISCLLKESGTVASTFANHEERTEQIAMLNAVARAFNTPSHLLVEAGTGTGKSIAYLIAAIYQATTRGEPVVISTNTLNLQDQLFYDEIPRLAASLDRPFTAMRLKGRTNYVCPRRVEVLRQRGNFTESEARLLARVLVWLDNTDSGDRSELHIQPDEEQVWEQISADAGSCTPARCAPYGTCYWQQAHEHAEGAHLLIVNHALLLADLSAGGGLIPPYQHLIIDEAHHLEEQGTRQFGFSLPENQLFDTLSRLGRERGGRMAGLLSRIREQARKHSQRDLSDVADRCGYLLHQVEQSSRGADELFDSIDEFLRTQPAQEHRYRILPEWRQLAEWQRLAQAVDDSCTELRLLVEGLQKLQEILRALSFDEATWQEPADECQRLLLLLETYSEEIDRILLHPQPDDITWIKTREVDNDEERGIQVSIYRAPLNIAPLLNEHLFSQKRSVVLTSATLSSEGSFAFVKERLGIADAEELLLGSPYNFSQQALVYVANDIPEPNQPHYASSIHRCLVDLARATEGRMLVLFTSKTQLRSAYLAISDPLAQDDIIVLGQYMDGSRTQLVERFRTLDRAVLLGTHSFWEGIDIPGPALSCLAITRLPFPVPTDPIQAARAQQYQDPFRDYAIPQTVIRFRQGFGRLLRATSDRGVVALLDSRLDNKRYGDTFLNSLPPINLRVGPFHPLPPLAARWLKEQS